MMYEQGNIAIIPFPFSDLSSVKQRPVLILSKDKDNVNSDDIITCGITSNLKDSHHSILINRKNIENGRIPRESRIKIDKLFTVDKKIIKKIIAKVNQETLKRVKKEFYNLI